MIVKFVKSDARVRHFMALCLCRLSQEHQLEDRLAGQGALGAATRLVAVSDSVRTKEIAAKVLINLACSMEGHQADTTVKNVLKCVAVLVTHEIRRDSLTPTRSSSAPRPFSSWPVYRKRGPCWPNRASSLY